MHPRWIKFFQIRFIYQSETKSITINITIINITIINITTCYYETRTKKEILNILLLSQFFSTTKGGGEYVFKSMAKNLTQNGHKVWVITNNVRGEIYPKSDSLKIITVNPTLEYKGGLPPTFLDNIRYVINAFQVGKKIIKSQDIDIIH